MFEVADKTQSLEEEKSLISAAMVSSKVVDECSEYLTPQDFHDQALGELWALMMTVRANGKPTKYAQLIADGADPQTLERCNRLVASALGFESYAKKIAEASQRRRVVGACLGIINFCQEAPTTDSFKEEVFDALLKGFGDPRAAGDTFTLRESAEQALMVAIKAFENGGDVSGLSTGFKDVDQKTTGLHPGELVILAARPGMGKTTFALNLARHVSNQSQVAFFSLEMPYEQLGGKMLSTEVEIGSQDLRTGRIGGCVDRLSDAVKKFNDLSLTIFDTSKATVGYMRSKLHQLEAKTGKPTDLIIIDYLQLMGGDNVRDSGNRVQEVSQISRGLKILAKDFRCPVIALSQLNRSLESRQDKRPLLSDLRESGSIEQDADIVMFLYRDDYYDQNAPPGISELILAKQRNGPRCTVPLYFDGRLSKFTDDNYAKELRTWHA